MNYATSANGLALIQEYEGFRAEPAQLPDGNWVVGYSHVRVGAPGESLSQNEAADLLSIDLGAYEKLVNARVTQSLSQGQFDALVSFAFSVGAEAFEQSQVLRRVNSNDFVAAACAMDAWRKSEVGGELAVVDALVRRRAAEKALFLKDLPHDASPSVLMRAKLDHAASILGAPAKPALKVEAAPIAANVVDLRPAADLGQRLTEILKSEPATEALLLTDVVIANDFADEDEGEIVTAHARPVARSIAEAREAARRAASEREALAPKGKSLLGFFKNEHTNAAAPVDLRLREQRQGKARFALPGFDVGASMENAGLLALLIFGLGLVAVAASLVLGGETDAVSLLAAGALGAPGCAASLMAGFGLMHGKHANA